MSLTALVFITGFSAAMLLALFRHPLYGLYAYAAVFYLHPPDRWWGMELPDLRWSLIAAIFTLAGTFRIPASERPAWTSSGAARILLILTAWIWVQNLWALSPEEHFELSVLFSKYALLFYLMYRLLDDEESVRRFLLVHVAGCFYLGWLVLMAPEGGRLEGVGGPGIDESNALGMQLATGAVAAGVLVVRGKLASRLFVLASGPLILNGVIQTGSRGAFLGLVCGGIAMVYLSQKPFRRYWYLFGVVAFVALLRLAPDNYWDRIDTIFDSARDNTEVDQSTEIRLVLLQAQWEMFLEYPLGTGHRGTAALSPRYLDAEHLTRTNPNEAGARSSHNTFMTALSEQGIPGGILYVLLLLWIFRTCRTIKAAAETPADAGINLYMTAAGSSLVVVTVAGMFTDYYKVEIFLWCTIILAVLETLSRQLERENEALETSGAVVITESRS